jgi:predicted O-methyltransferase YrrM
LGGQSRAAYLPEPAASFYTNALAEATRLNDQRTLEQRSSPRSLAALVCFAHGRKHVVEIGTSAGWAALPLALVDEERRVVTLDPFPHPHREYYAALLPPPVRSRVDFLERYGEQGPLPDQSPVDFLFIDEAHERTGVMTCFRAWRHALESGGLVVFHDYDSTWPGVIDAVRELGLSDRVRAKSFIWRAPG